jgi:hypothetical protein
MIGAPVAPLTITQDNCLAACGLEPRRFLALIHERNIPHTKLGKLRVVRATDLLAALNAEAAPSEPHPTAPTTTQTSRLARAAGLA